MKLKITYDKTKDKFYFDYDDGTLETFYGTYATYERLIELYNDYTIPEGILNQVLNSDFGLTVEI